MELRSIIQDAQEHRRPVVVKDVHLEELQSTNEELQTINRELRDRSEALNDVNDFLESIMRGLRGAVVVVNQELQVIAWNHRSEEMWGLRAGEVRNKNVFALDIGLPIEQFRHELRACLSGESEMANLTVHATNRRGKPVECTVVHAALRQRPHPGRDRDGRRGGAGLRESRPSRSA